MEEVALVNKQIIIRFTTVVHNLATFPGQITSCNTHIEIYWRVTKNLAINIRFVVIKGYNLECPIRFFVHFSQTFTITSNPITCNHLITSWEA